MEKVKDLLWRKWLEVISSPEEENKHWFNEYGASYHSALQAAKISIELAEKLRSKQRGKKSKDKIASKISKVLDTAMAPGKGRRSLHKWDEAKQRWIPPADKEVVKQIYKNKYQLIKEVRNDYKTLGAPTDHEAYRRLSNKTYCTKVELSDFALSLLPDDPQKRKKLEESLRYALPLSKIISSEKFEYYMSIKTHRDAAIEMTADYFKLEPETVRKKLS
jgi:hypothetical protein